MADSENLHMHVVTLGDIKILPFSSILALSNHPLMAPIIKINKTKQKTKKGKPFMVSKFDSAETPDFSQQSQKLNG